MQLQPLGDRVVVTSTDDAESRTPSGLVIPDTAKEKPQIGEVVAVGPGARDDD
ncbi:MAG: co-chaperone GroES, partial [Actinobacteria bacterium]|nr:co-chaperone GroES [Actinomycetota bacterium]